MPEIDRIQSTQWVNTRRSQRVVLKVPVLVRALMTNKDFCEKSHTLVVNAHGALIALRVRMDPKQPLILRNEVTGQELECCVIHVAEGRKTAFEVGVKFSEPAPYFWNVGFPSDDRAVDVNPGKTPPLPS